MERRQLPPLTALRAFEAFARRGRMTLAADELCVTHGAISRQIRSLEEALGLALTEGPRHRLELTEAGARLVVAPQLVGQGRTGLEGLTRLTTGSRQTAWAEWEGHSRITLPTPPDTQEFEHIFYTLEAAASGLGVGLSPWIYVAGDVAAGRLA